MTKEPLNPPSINPNFNLLPETQEFIKEHGLNSFIKDIEKRAMIFAMKESLGKINQVQRTLKISKSLLYRIHQELIENHGEGYYKN